MDTTVRGEANRLPDPGASHARQCRRRPRAPSHRRSVAAGRPFAVRLGPPSAQIPACRATALGSCLGF